MLPSPAKRAWTMDPRPEWVVTVRMMGTSKETYPADCCATAPYAAPSLSKPQHRLLPREGLTPAGARTSSGLPVLDQGDGRGGRIVSTVLIRKRPQFDSLHQWKL